MSCEIADLSSTDPFPAAADARRRPRFARLAALADRFGATASFLCAIHCALLPFVIAVLPALGLAFLADHGIERGFVLFACLLAATMLLLGYRRHRRPNALLVLLPAVLLLLWGVLLDAEQASVAHAWLVSSGGTLLALAHLINLRLSHVHDANCRHE
jgi:MerC mercury resistance protein